MWDSHIILCSFIAQHCWSELWAVPWRFLQTLRCSPWVSSRMHTWAETCLFFSPSLINCCYCMSSARASDNLPDQLHTCLCWKGQYDLFLFIWSIRTSIPLRYRLKSIYSPFIFKSVATEHFHQTHFQCRGFWKQIKLHYVGYLWERLEQSSNRVIFTEGSSLSIDRHQRLQHVNTTGTSAWVTAKLGLAIVYATLMGCGCPSPHK